MTGRAGAENKEEQFDAFGVRQERARKQWRCSRQRSYETRRKKRIHLHLISIMTASMSYYPHRLLEYGTDCHHDAPEQLSSSISVILIALAISEVAILLLCRAMAWYADLVFYSHDWTTTGEDRLGKNKQQRRSPEQIAQSLHTLQYERRQNTIVNEDECTCPICLVEFGKLLLYCW